MPALYSGEHVVQYLIALNKCLYVIPSDVSTFGDQWDLIKTMLNRFMMRPSVVICRGSVVASDPIHILAVVAIYILHVLVVVVHAFKNPVAILVIVRTKHIAVSKGKQAAFNAPIAVKVI